MQLDRRRLLRSGLRACVTAAVWPASLLPQGMLPPDEVEVLALVLRLKCATDGRHPVLVAMQPFHTGPMSVLASHPTPLERAMHYRDSPYLTPSVDRKADAEELAAAYNDSLGRPAQRIVDSAGFSFPHRLLDEQAVAQFEALHPSGAVSSEEIEAKRRAVPPRYRKYFAGSATLWRITRVCFTTNGSLATLGLRGSGGSCVEEDWTVLERSQGTWRSLPWGNGRLTCA